MRHRNFGLPRRAAAVRVAASLFILVAAVSAVASLAAAASPGLSVGCRAGGCFHETRLLALAPDNAQRALAASSAAQAEFVQYVARPAVRAGLAGIQLVAGLPFVALMFTVGIALRRLAERGEADLGRAIPWLRRASISALLMTVTTPVADSLRAMTLLPGTPVGRMWYIELDVRRLVMALLLALAAYAVAWALDTGSQAQRDAAGFV